jgi:hypothetical protein
MSPPKIVGALAAGQTDDYGKPRCKPSPTKPFGLGPPSPAMQARGLINMATDRALQTGCLSRALPLKKRRHRARRLRTCTVNTNDTLTLRSAGLGISSDSESRHAQRQQKCESRRRRGCGKPGQEYSAHTGNGASSPFSGVISVSLAPGLHADRQGGSALCEAPQTDEPWVLPIRCTGPHTKAAGMQKIDRTLSLIDLRRSIRCPWLAFSGPQEPSKGRPVQRYSYDACIGMLDRVGLRCGGKLTAWPPKGGNSRFGTETSGDSKDMMTRSLTMSGIAAGFILALASCTNPYDPTQRAVGGGLLGAGAGAAIGGAVGGGHGAAVGAAIGGATGALTGAATTPPPPPPPPPQGQYVPGFGYPPPGYGQPAPGYGYQPSNYGQPAPGYGYPPSGYSQPAPGYGYPAPSPPPGYPSY